MSMRSCLVLVSTPAIRELGLARQSTNYPNTQPRQFKFIAIAMSEHESVKKYRPNPADLSTGSTSTLHPNNSTILQYNLELEYTEIYYTPVLSI